MSNKINEFVDFVADIARKDSIIFDIDIENMPDEQREAAVKELADMGDTEKDISLS